MDFPAESPIYRAEEPFDLLEGRTIMIAQWFPLARLAEERLYPPFLVQGLQTLPVETVHIVDDGR